MEFFERLRKGLSRPRQGWVGRLQALFRAPRWDAEVLAAVEETLISADVGVKATRRLLEAIHQRSLKIGGDSPSDLLPCLEHEILGILAGQHREERVPRYSVRPWVVMFVGVNGVGKTTTIGKLAAQQSASGKKVLLVAADTFRAAAIEQLEIWGERVGAEVVKHQPGQDPSGVAFDAVRAAKKRAADVVLVDTAGRLHTKTPLLEELKKMKRVIDREQPGAPHETLLVLDASTGQNAFQQAKVFKGALDITGIVLTKLDGTAKGGVIIGIREELGIPVQYIGVGEEIEDLQPFDPARFVQALFA